MSDVWISAPEEEYTDADLGVEEYGDDQGTRRWRQVDPGRARISIDDLAAMASSTIRPRLPAWNFTHLTRRYLDPDWLVPEQDLPHASAFEYGHERYATLMRQGFNFIRQHGDRRYSDTTLMRLVRAAEQAERSAAGAQLSNMPNLVVVEAPTAYDEETEVKTGGISAMAICWPHNDGKTVLAVHRDKRRSKYGTLVLRALQESYCMTPALWVSARNFTAQQFLLSVGLMPTSLNGAGAVRYSDAAQEEE